MRLLLFNLATDSAHPLLGFATIWIRELARRCEAIDVLTMQAGAHDLPGNARVFSVGRELGWGRPRRLSRFYWLLTRLLAERRYHACFAHMTPLFAGLGGPLLRSRGIPITLWYTHRQRSRQLRLGMAMSRRVVSAHDTSFPYATAKLRVIGHGIDTDFYAPAPGPPPRNAAGSDQALVLQVGRLAAIKHQAATLRAVAGTGANLAFVGGAQPGPAQDYAQRLRQLCGELDMTGRCHFTGELPAAQARDWQRRAAVAVNASPIGLFDKSALESMACALPTIVCNPAFAPLMGEYRDLLLFDAPDDVDGLRERLRHLLGMPAEQRRQIGNTLRAGVLREHSQEQLMEKLMSVLRTGEIAQPA